MRKLTAADVTFTVSLEQEQKPVRGHFASGDDALDREQEEEIIESLNAGNVEAWCCIQVTAEWTAPNGVEHTGHDYLGCCSHLGDKLDEQVEQTVESHGMRDEALADLNANLERLAASLPSEGCAVTDANDTREINILSIDAWADGDDGWTWNNWFKVGTCALATCDLTDLQIIAYMVDEGYLLPDAATRVAVDDDQYNKVIIDKETGEPLFALEYGPAV